MAALREHVTKAQVVHAGLDDLNRPISFEGFRMGYRLNKPTIFVQDTDIALQQIELAAEQRLGSRIKALGYSKIYEQLVRWSVRRADLSLLKGSSLMRKYGDYAKNAQEIQHSMHSSNDVITDGDLDKRLAFSQGLLRLVYCGRLLPRKGLDRSIKLVSLVRKQGIEVEFDLIGEGPCRADLEFQIAEAGLTDKVRLLGCFPYGTKLLERLSKYDALLFTPKAEDTPRMIFDGYAAGLPLVASSIEYVKERRRNGKGDGSTSSQGRYCRLWFDCRIGA